MRVSIDQPPAGKRNLICQGDEATVQRILSGKYKGMVERLQPLRKGEYEFVFRVSSVDNSYGYPNDSLSYHLLKFLALGLARSLYPRNFVDSSELRFFFREGTPYSAMYSNYVPDENGVIERRKTQMERYYNEESAVKRLLIMAESDVGEFTQNPKLNILQAEMHAIGIGVAHPAANYHVKEGEIIFFEVNELMLDRIVRFMDFYFSGDKEKQDAFRHLSTFYSLLLKIEAINMFSRLESDDPRYIPVNDFVRMPFQGVFDAVRCELTYKGLRGAMEFLSRGIGIIMHGSNIPIMEEMALKELEAASPSCEFDESFTALLEGRPITTDLAKILL